MVETKIRKWLSKLAFNSYIIVRSSSKGVDEKKTEESLFKAQNIGQTLAAYTAHRGKILARYGSVDHPMF